MKILAIDGNSILNRAFYGIKLLSTKEGVFTNGIYGFLTILMRMEEETKPDAVVVTFDMRGPTFRHKKFDGYKANRKGMPQELAQQMPILQELLGYLGYPIVKLEGFEADDLLGTISRGACEKGHKCVIATGDRDSFQLIDACTTVRLASTKGGKPQAEIWDEAGIFEKYGVTPTQLIEVKALMGDSSDNIPGVAGVGEKTALDLIQKFKSLAYIYDNIDTIEIREPLRLKLKTSTDMAKLSRELALIDRYVPIEANTENYSKLPIDNNNSYDLMKKLELFSLIPRLGVTLEQRDNTAENSSNALVLESNALEISFESNINEWLPKVNSLDFLCQFNNDNSLEALCIKTPTKLYLYDITAIEVLKSILISPLPKRVNNLKLLHHFAAGFNISIENIIMDIEIAGYILSPTSTDYSISRLASEYAVKSQEIASYLGDYGDLIQSTSSISDLCDALNLALLANNQAELMAQIEIPLAKVLASMEIAGFYLDAKGLAEYGLMLDEKIQHEQKQIFSLAGEEFNTNSPKQLGVILFEKLGLPAKKKTKTGYSTNADVLESLLGKHEIIQNIMNYRQYAKLKSTYVDGLIAQIRPDGRIHTTFQQTLTRTGRISSTEPNLQNIPIRTPLGSELRRFFCAEDSKILVDADYSQIELRVLAHIAKDENMTTAFADGEDIHTNTAAQVFDLPPMFVTPLMRSRAKAVNFGIVYGIGAFSLSQDINVSVAEADKYIKSYLSTYSGVRQYMEDTIKFGTDNGYVKTIFERRRYLPELASSNHNMREFGKRIAMNTPIQGTAADIIKIAMIKVYNRLKKENLESKLILQIHDELIIESPEHEVQIVKALLQEEMQDAVLLNVPLVADVNTGKNWFESK